MFPLNTVTFPATAAELAKSLNASLRQQFGLPRDPVEVREKAYPHLESVAVSLDGAELLKRPPEIPAAVDPPQPALRIDSFRVNASPLSVGPAAVDFQLSARDVTLSRASDRDGRLLLLLQNAADGRLEISLAVTDLEALILEVAKAEAGKHGVNVDSIQLSLTARGPRSLAVEVQLQAKKFFVNAALQITGHLDLDQELNAKISGLVCTGQGAIATVACGILKPHLEKLDGREFSLMSLPLGEVRLRDVRVAVDEKLTVTAEFGSARE